MLKNYFLFLHLYLHITSQLITCCTGRIFCIVMIGLVLPLHGYLRNIICIMAWIVLELSSPFTILSLEHLSLEKQWRMLTRPPLLVYNFWLLFFQCGQFVNYVFIKFLIFHHPLLLGPNSNLIWSLSLILCYNFI